MIWFERGERLTSKALRRIAKRLTPTLIEALKGLGDRKPGRKKLADRLREILEQSSWAEDRGELDEAAREEVDVG